MPKKIVIKADIVGKKCKSEVMAAAAKFEGIKSMDIDAEKCTLTVVGDVDPVCLVQCLRTANFAAIVVSVEEDKPKPNKTPAEEACEKACKEKCEKLCKDACCEKAFMPHKCEKLYKDACCCEKAFMPNKCEKLCKDACCCESGAWSGNVQPNYPYNYGYGYGGVPAPPGYRGYRCYEEQRSPGGECTIQ